MNARQWLIGAGLVPAALFLSAAAAQDIYKTVDADGNVVYTDRKPSEDVEPIPLPELTVVDPVQLGEPGAIDEAGETAFEATGPALRILAPEPGETIWNTAYVLSVEVDAAGPLPSGAQLVYLIDGEEFATTRSQSIELEEVYRGERRLTVELRSGDGEVLSTAGPVTFYMRQHSRLHPNPNGG